MSNTDQIQRYSISDRYEAMDPDNEGEFVKFKDHEKSLIALKTDLLNQISRVVELETVMTEIKRTLSHSPTDELIRSLIKTVEV